MLLGITWLRANKCLGSLPWKIKSKSTYTSECDGQCKRHLIVVEVVYK